MVGGLCADNHGLPLYRVQTSPDQPWWKLEDMDGNELLRVRAGPGGHVWAPSPRLPLDLFVFVGDEEVAHIHRAVTLATPTTHVECLGPEPKEYTVQQRAIYLDKRLVGRIFYLRRHLYLDIEEDHLNNATLALFVTMAR